MKPESNNKRPSRCLARLVRLFAARCGYVLLPISEIERMEEDAASYYRAMKGGIFDETGIGYFNGLADHASKTAIQLREKYLPNSNLSQPKPE